MEVKDTDNSESIYDLIIIGAGPSGLTASIYASCYHLKHLVIGEVLGGQLQFAPDILNYPGFENISGKELTDRLVQQVKKRGGELVTQSVTRITQLSNTTNNPINATMKSRRSGIHDAVIPIKSGTASGQFNNETMEGRYFEIETKEGNKYQTRTIILATGTERRKLNVAGEVEYTGKGVLYCATCGKQDYEGQICAVVGGANSAVQAAVELSQAASKVYIIYRGGELRGDPIWLEQVTKNQKIEVIYNTVVTEIVGDGERLTGVRIKPVTSVTPVISENNPITSRRSGIHDAVIPIKSGTASGQLSNQPINNPINQPANQKISGEDTSDGGEATTSTPPRWSNQNSEILSLDKIFIEIGGVPGTALVIPLGVEVDTGGYIKVNARLATNIPGIFAAGDLVSYGLSIEQISSAVGLGARAASSAFAYIKQEKPPIVWGESKIKR